MKEAQGQVDTEGSELRLVMGLEARGYLGPHQMTAHDVWQLLLKYHVFPDLAQGTQGDP